MSLQFRKFAGDLASGKATWYDFKALTFYWLFYWGLKCTTPNTVWNESLSVLYSFGVIASVAMVAYMSVWSIRPLIAVLLVCLGAVIVGESGLAWTAAAAAVLGFCFRAFNTRLRVAPHPSLQLDRLRPAFYEND